jgi:hypothetical protein
MKINELNEAPLGMLGTAYQKAISKIPGSIGASAQGKLDTSATEKRIQGLNDFALRKWNEQLPTVKTMPGAADPETYYSYVKQFLNKYYKNQVTAADLTAIPNPTTISTQGVQNIINQATGKYLQNQAGFTAPATAPTAPNQQAQTSNFGTAGGLKSTNVNVKYGQAPTAAQMQTGNKPMSYSGTAKATLGGTAQPYSVTPATQKSVTPAAAPPSITPRVKPKMSVKAATGPAQQPAVAQPTAAPKTAAPASNYASVQQSITGLNKREKQKILTQLLSQLGTNVR